VIRRELRMQRDVEQASEPRRQHRRHRTNRRRIERAVSDDAQAARPLRDQHAAVWKKCDAPRMIESLDRCYVDAHAAAGRQIPRSGAERVHRRWTAAACLLLTGSLRRRRGRRVLCCFNRRRRSGDDGNDTNHESFQRSLLFLNSSLLRSARSTSSCDQLSRSTELMKPCDPAASGSRLSTLRYARRTMSSAFARVIVVRSRNSGCSARISHLLFRPSVVDETAAILAKAAVVGIAMEHVCTRAVRCGRPRRREPSSVAAAVVTSIVAPVVLSIDAAVVAPVAGVAIARPKLDAQR
jgi:hypothetical protein